MHVRRGYNLQVTSLKSNTLFTTSWQYYLHLLSYLSKVCKSMTGSQEVFFFSSNNALNNSP